LKLHKFYGPDGKHAPREGINKNYQDQVDHWLQRLGLAEIQDRYPGQISGGQQQRTAIARSLILDPNLLLMDEPLGSLDAPTSANLQQLLLEINQEDGLALVLVTHSVETAAYLGQKILLLAQPPVQDPEVITNPGSGSDAFRESIEYQDLCHQLRSRLEGCI
jgi:NitT/TauT family transport system ATP-binding protein